MEAIDLILNGLSAAAQYLNEPIYLFVTLGVAAVLALVMVNRH